VGEGVTAAALQRLAATLHCQYAEVLETTTADAVEKGSEVTAVP
jgi:hypothetical protein